MPHFTQHNKVDPDFGVASMSTLFGTVGRRDMGDMGGGAFRHNDDNVLHLPDRTSQTVSSG